MAALRQSFSLTLTKKFPHLNDLYKAIYTKGDKSYWTDLAIASETYCTDNDIRYTNYFYHEELVKAKFARQAEEKLGAAVSKGVFALE